MANGFETQTTVGSLHDLAARRHRVELLAGAAGLRNSVSWVYLAEDINNASFLRGGEFVITTGLFAKDGNSLGEFIEAMAAGGCSAVLVNVGDYLSRRQVDEQAVPLCERLGLPLFVMPWQVHLVDVMREFSAALLNDRQRQSSLDAAFEAAIYQSSAPTSVVHGLHQFGFPERAPYRVVVMHNLDHPAAVRSAFNRRGMRYHLFRHDNLHVLVHALGQPALCEAELVDLLGIRPGMSVGISAVLDDLAELGAAYRRALFSLSVAELWQRPYVSFAELGALQLLFCVSDQRLLEDLRTTYLGRLETYDADHGSDLVRTLRVFLLSDCSVRRTAEKLPAHRNTVVHRMGRVKDVLGVDFDDASAKFNLLLAFYIREYLAM